MPIPVPGGSPFGFKYIFRGSFIYFVSSFRYMSLHHLLCTFHNTLFRVGVLETFLLRSKQLPASVFHVS